LLLALLLPATSLLKRSMKPFHFAAPSATLAGAFMPALELKGRMASLTRLRLLDPDLAAVRAHLADLARRMPDAVRGMPVVIEADFVPDLGALREALRAVGMQPVGVSEGPLADAARALGLAVLPETKAVGAPSGATVAAKAVSTTAARKPARIIDVPVRSGQQVYAEGADLVVTAPVSPGAEIIADGCVHAYAPLRGRAIAGARGDEGARIFCRKFEAELVAVAGVYAVAEQMQGVRGSPVQAYLEQGKLKIEVMS
jgi:septum site-determining protein MinC